MGFIITKAVQGIASVLVLGFIGYAIVKFLKVLIKGLKGKEE